MSQDDLSWRSRANVVAANPCTLLQVVLEVLSSLKTHQVQRAPLDSPLSSEDKAEWANQEDSGGPGVAISTAPRELHSEVHCALRSLGIEIVPYDRALEPPKGQSLGEQDIPVAAKKRVHLRLGHFGQDAPGVGPQELSVRYRNDRGIAT